MKLYTISVDNSANVQFALCSLHEESMRSYADGASRLVVTEATRGTACEVCRQDKIRAAIRSLGSF